MDGDRFVAGFDHPMFVVTTRRSRRPRRPVGRIVERAGLGDHTGFLLAPTDVTIGAEAVPLSFRALPDLEPGHGAG
ncbi:hypothetical protein ACQEU6_13055 [Spirillospora sp. CA-108201]